MAKHPVQSQGFVLIAALLLLFLLSGVAVGVMMLTTSEIRIGGNDKETQMAYYGAESGMEKLTSDLAALYGKQQAPSAATIQALATTPYFPNNAMVGPMTYTESITFPLDPLNPGRLAPPTPQTISSGPNQGLTALILPMTMTVNAMRPSLAEASITRQVEVALIPVFQFGIFSNGSLNVFNGATFGFGGRIHTNGNFFITPQANGNTLLGDKTTVVGEVILDRMQNGLPPGAAFNGTAYQAKAAQGCAAALAVPRAPLAAETNCAVLPPVSASWTGGIPAAGAANPTWINTSTASFNGYIGTALSTGVKPLVLPFAQGGGLQNDIIRKPFPLEDPNSPTGQSRLYNKANMRVLLADTLANLHPERGVAALDAEDVNLTATAGNLTVFGGVAVGGIVGGAVDAVAWADPAVDLNWKTPLPSGVATTPFPLITGWLRVEYKDSNDVWLGITNEWLGLGIGRGASPTAGPNSTASSPGAPNPNAILIFQELVSDNTGNPILGRTAPGIGTNWYPINFYDTREGQVRAVKAAGSACSINGIMNAVELDVANLRKWGTGSVNGGKVEYLEQNGYVLYFSDRRGMLPNPRANPNEGPSPVNTPNGEYGFEDVVNDPTSVAGLPNGVDGGVPEAGEDLDGSGRLDTYGAANVGNGFRIPTNAAGYPYTKLDYVLNDGALNCLNQGRMNRVTGARHVLRLIDGSVGKLPLSPKNGGFTVASENPVYVFGDYNANAAQVFTDVPLVHSPAAILADAVTLLSNNWNDIRDMTSPSDPAGRLGATTYYRMAVEGGNSGSFANPLNANDLTWGTDGGVHNFLRYIENWSNGSTLFYQGSLVSLYNSTYATGTYKFSLVGANSVYSAPNRAYSFDTLFLDPTTLPPATPMFQDVVNLSYRQDFTPY
jgi:hypothetical protein